MNWISLVNTYLTQRRQLGYLLISEGQYLHSFAVFAETKDISSLTKDLALQWANMAPSGSDIAIARRFSLLRPFSRYLVMKGCGSTILPANYAGPTHRRLPPYIFSQLEIMSLMDAADKLVPLHGLRPITMRALIGLLVSTGLRPGEAVRLQSNCVDLERCEITINNSKGWKTRTVPLSPSTMDKLSVYRTSREQHNILSNTGMFFEFDQYQPLNIRAADYAFQVIRKATGCFSNCTDRQPRLYNLRHTFVCRRVLDWYQSGINIDCRISQLSNYLGHKKVSHTYWYLTAIPKLMHCAAERFSDNSHESGSYNEKSI